jgi:hypothetical protein
MVSSYFRFEEVRHGTGYTDEWGEYVSTGSYVRLQLREFKVIKETPQGVRINAYDWREPNGKLILRTWNKQWACPTVEEARLSFIARKRRQMQIYEARLRTAKTAMELAEKGFKSEGDRLYSRREPLPTEVPWIVGHRPPWSQRAPNVAS